MADPAELLARTKFNETRLSNSNKMAGKQPPQRGSLDNQWPVYLQALNKRFASWQPCSLKLLGEHPDCVL